MRANKGEIKKRVTIAFDAEHKVLIQLGTSAGVLKNQSANFKTEADIKRYFPKTYKLLFGP